MTAVAQHPGKGVVDRDIRRRHEQDPLTGPGQGPEQLNAPYIFLGPIPFVEASSIIREAGGLRSLSQSAMRTLVEAVEGNPLALRLTGLLLKHQTDGADWVADALSDERTWFGTRRPLREVLALVERVLTADARLAFHALAAFGGPDFSLAAARAIVPELRGRIEQALAQLVRLELLRQDGDRYAFSNRVLRDYVEQTSPLRHEVDERRAWAVRYFADEAFDRAAKVDSPDAIPASTWFGAELSNLLWAHQVAATLADWDVIGRLTTGLSRYLEASERSADLVLVQERTLAAARRVGYVEVELDTLLLLGTLYRRGGQYHDALGAHREALNLAGRLGSRAGEARARLSIGLLHRDRGELAESTIAIEHAAAIFQQLGDLKEAAHAFHILGGAYAGADQVADAIAAYDQSLALYGESGDSAGTAAVMVELGHLHASSGELDDALSLYERALDVMHENNDQPGETRILISLGNVFAQRGNYDQAVQYYRRSLSLLDSIGDRADVGRVTNALGTALGNMGALDEAIHSFAQALAIATELGDHHDAARASLNLGRVRAEREQWDAAVAAYEQAIDSARMTGDRRLAAHIAVHLGRSLGKLGRWAEAVEVFESSLAAVRELNDLAGQAAVLIDLGTAYFAMGRPDEASVAYESGAALGRESGDWRVETLSLLGLAHVYATLSQTAEMEQIYKRVLQLVTEAAPADTPDLMASIGGIYASIGDYSAARSWLERSRASGDEAAAAKASRLLDGLPPSA